MTELIIAVAGRRPALGRRARIFLLLACSAAVADGQVIAITGGKVYPVVGAPIENGTVIIRDGRIAAVGTGLAIPEGARRVEATGRWVTPGLVDASTELGLGDVGFGADRRDVAARGHDAIAAGFAVSDGLDPASVLIPPAREDGVTTVGLVPSGSLVAGQAAAIDLIEGTAADMILRTPVAMVAQLGDPGLAGVGARGELIAKLRDLLDDARAYGRRRSDYERNQTRAFSATRRDLEAMVSVVDGRVPLLVAADRASDIEAALKIGRDYGVRVLIAGGAEAWLVADHLASARVGVFAGAMNNIPATFSALGTRQENVAVLRRAGVAVAIIGNAGGGDEEMFNVRNVRIEAGNAVAYGLPWDDALRAVTLAPAELLGIADRVGSLAPGREANVVVWSGDPLEISSRAEHVFVRGVEYTVPSRQGLLMQRYRTLPPVYGRP